MNGVITLYLQIELPAEHLRTASVIRMIVASFAQNLRPQLFLSLLIKAAKRSSLTGFHYLHIGYDETRRFEAHQSGRELKYDGRRICPTE